MKKKIIILVLVCTLLAILVFSFIWAPAKKNKNADSIAISWNLDGSFLNNNSNARKINLSIEGSINPLPNDHVDLDIDITPNDEFEYTFISHDLNFTSSNQKHNDLPHLLISPCYTYNKLKNESTVTYFALDLEKEYFIAIFDDMPNYYLVAAESLVSDYNHLLDYFSDFIDSYAPNLWN